MPTRELQTHYDVVIVGSGHNGLVAAAYLARAGKSVLVLERNATVGGATASKKVFPDYEAYLSTYSYLVSLFPDKIVRDLGLEFTTRRRRTASFTAYTGERGQPCGLVLSNEDESRSQQSMRAMTGSDQAWTDYNRLLDLEQAIAAHAWPSMLEPLRSRKDFQDRMRSSTEREAWTAFVEEPLGNVIERYAEHDALRGLLLTDGKIGVFAHAHDPSLLQNRCFLYHVIGGGTGEWRVPVGGMRALVGALVRSCLSAGVTIETSAPAVGVELGADRHTVRFERGDREERVDAGVVLVNAGPRTFDRLLGASTTPKEEDEGSVIKVNMLLRRLPRLRAEGVNPAEAFAGSFHIDEGYAQMQRSYEEARAERIPNPAPGEIYCHTLTDPSILSDELREQGFQTITLFGLDMPYRLFQDDHDVRRQRVLELYLEGLDRICAEPFIDCVARDQEGNPCIEIKSPQDIENEVDLDLGNIFQNAPTWFFAEDAEAVGTWGVETAYPRVFRAGSAAFRGGAVSGIPGHNAAMAVLLGG